MIQGYLRPKTIEEAVGLLQKAENYIPLAGGSVVSKAKEDVILVDLQDLGLNTISDDNRKYHIGATVTLENIYDYFHLSEHFSSSLKIEAAKNMREQATIAGTICTADGRSPFLTLLLGLDAEISWEPGNQASSLGDWLMQRSKWQKSNLITGIKIDKNVTCKFDSVARSPLDIPIVCTALRVWSSKRLRVAIGGFGQMPKLVLDGNTDDDLETAIRSSFSEASDQWASAEYRISTAIVLAKRALKELLGQEDAR